MAASPQLALFDAPPSGPEGFDYRPDFISPREEAALAAHLAELPFKPFEFRGFLGRRRTVSFGWRYDFSGAALVKADDIPAWLIPLRDRCAALAGVGGDEIAHALLNEYLPGAPIGWHRDRPAFDKVVGLSLLSPCTMRFRQRTGEGFARLNARLEPRSAYLLEGPARRVWEHSIPEAPALRYSITFRTFAGSPPA